MVTSVVGEESLDEYQSESLRFRSLFIIINVKYIFWILNFSELSLTAQARIVSYANNYRRVN